MKNTILYVTDLHGDKNKYLRTIDLAKRYHVNIVINGGDMLPNEHRYQSQPEFMQGFLETYFEVFDDLKINYLAMFGNNDLSIYDQRFTATCQAHPYVFDLNDSRIKLNGYEFIGMNSVLDCPFPFKNRVVFEDGTLQKTAYGTPMMPEAKGYKNINDWDRYFATQLPSMRDELKALPHPNDYSKTVFVMHMPPTGLGLDISSRTKTSIGSKEIKNFLSDKQPLLSLHGHVHESPSLSGVWMARNGKTTCIQPGQYRDGEHWMTYVLLDLEHRKYTKETCRV